MFPGVPGPVAVCQSCQSGNAKSDRIALKNRQTIFLRKNFFINEDMANFAENFGDSGRGVRETDARSALFQYEKVSFLLIANTLVFKTNTNINSIYLELFNYGREQRKIV